MYARPVAATLILLFVLVPSASAVTNGQPDGNGHPYVGLVRFSDNDWATCEYPHCWRCSGALVSSTVFLTAGHCTDGSFGKARIWFAADADSAGYPNSGYVTGTPHTMPGYRSEPLPGLPGFDYHDVGIVVLDAPVTDKGHATMPQQGFVDTLAMKTEVAIVGYGVQEKLQISGNPYYRWTGLRVRFVAPSLLIQSNDRISNEYLKLTANPAQGKGGTCFGDSGGPILLGGTVLGVNSFVTNSNCAGVTYSNRVDTYALEWIDPYLPP